MSSRAHGLAICCIVLTALAAVNALDTRAGQNPVELKRYELSEPHMGTLFRITLYAPDEATAKKAARSAFARIAELNRIMSDYLEDSELMRLCKTGGTLPVSVGEDLFTILQTSLEVGRLSGGAFDVTVGPVVRLWRRTRRTLELPSPAELKKAMSVVGSDKIRLDPARRSVQLLVDGMLLDLGGIAKGYAAEEALAVLRRFGITRALIAAGGDIVAGDAPPGAPGWKVAVQALSSVEAPAEHVLMLRNHAVSTSGDANQFAVIGGKRYSHVIDPRTGMGLVGRRSISVVAKSGTRADAFDTAVGVMGPEKGLKLIESQDDLACLYVQENAKGEIESKMSSRLARFLAKK